MSGKFEMKPIAGIIVGTGITTASLPIKYTIKSQILDSVKYIAMSAAITINTVALTGTSGKTGIAAGLITFIGITTAHNIFSATNDKIILLENINNTFPNSTRTKLLGEFYNNTQQDQIIEP